MHTQTRTHATLGVAHVRGQRVTTKCLRGLQYNGTGSRVDEATVGRRSG
jgi:hypothetical protein